MTDEQPDPFEAIIEENIDDGEVWAMMTSAGRFAHLHYLQQRAVHFHQRTHLYADEHPEALTDVVDPTIRLSEQPRWALPAGWVPIMNRLHTDLSEIVSDYEVLDASQKAGGLRLHINPVARDEAFERITAARTESMHVCELCGEPRSAAVPRFSTRCSAHPISGPDRMLGALARPPGWEPGMLERRIE